MEPNPTDESLLERIRADDPEAFERLAHRWSDRILGFGMRVCGEREDARDVLQETLLQAFRSLKNLEHPAALGSWLYRVAANACLMKRRRRKGEPERELSLEELAPRGRDDLRLEIPDPAGLPDELAARSELRARLERAILDLPPAYRIVLVLRDMEHLPAREVSRILGLPVSTVKMRLHRARLKVRQTLQRALVPPTSAVEPR